MACPQKVVIPKGLVNPGETTIIEIPKNLQNVGTVVARPRPVAYDPDACPPATPKMAKKRTYTRKTYPPRKAAGYGGLDDAGLTFGGFPNEESPCPSPPQFKPWYPISPRDRYGDISSTPEVSYAVCQPGKAGFDPPLTSSTLRDIDDPRETSLYRDFRPGGKSSRHGSPARTPGSMKRYHSSLGDFSPDQDSSYYESSCVSESPCETREDVSQEKSYYDSSGDANVEYGSGCSPCDGGDGSSGGYRKFDSSGSPGSPGYQKCDSSGGYSPPPRSPSGACPAKKITQREVMNSLGELEATELNQIMGDLNQFQNARRRLVFDASSLASAADVSTSLLSSSG